MQLAVVWCKSTQLRSRMRTANQKAKPCYKPSPITEKSAWLIGYSPTDDFPHSASAVKTPQRSTPCPAVLGVRSDSWLRRQAKVRMPLGWSNAVMLEWSLVRPGMCLSVERGGCFIRISMAHLHAAWLHMRLSNPTSLAKCDQTGRSFHRAKTDRNRVGCY
jgi:hypothetical protein